jgi:hypothetical protein
MSQDAYAACLGMAPWCSLLTSLALNPARHQPHHLLLYHLHPLPALVQLLEHGSLYKRIQSMCTYGHRME